MGPFKFLGLSKVDLFGHPDGAIINRNKQQPGVVADSIPAGKLHGQLQGSKDGMNLRHFVEELANRTAGNTIMDNKTVFSSPPTFIGQDNKSILYSITKVEGGKGKGLRREARVMLLYFMSFHKRSY